MSFISLRLSSPKMISPLVRCAKNPLSKTTWQQASRAMSAVTPPLHAAISCQYRMVNLSASPVNMSILTTTPTQLLATTSMPSAFSSLTWRALVNLSVWLIKRTFQPSLLRRKRNSGFLVRNRTNSGRKILNRRRAKGRKRLCGGI